MKGVGGDVAGVGGDVAPDGVGGDVAGGVSSGGGDVAGGVNSVGGDVAGAAGDVAPEGMGGGSGGMATKGDIADGARSKGTGFKGMAMKGDDTDGVSSKGTEEAGASKKEGAAETSSPRPGGRPDYPLHRCGCRHGGFRCFNRRSLFSLRRRLAADRLVWLCDECDRGMIINGVVISLCRCDCQGCRLMDIEPRRIDWLELRREPDASGDWTLEAAAYYPHEASHSAPSRSTRLQRHGHEGPLAWRGTVQHPYVLLGLIAGCAGEGKGSKASRPMTPCTPAEREARQKASGGPYGRWASGVLCPPRAPSADGFGP